MFTNNFKFELFSFKLRERRNRENGALSGLLRIVKNINNF